MIYGITLILREDAQILTAKQVYTTKGIASKTRSYRRKDRE